MAKKVLVTGANGYIGRHVVTELLDLGFEVIAADIRTDGVDPRAEKINASIFDPKDDYFEFFGKPDVLIHMAWRDGFVHNSINHMGDLSGHFKFLANMIDHGLKNVAVMGTMHEVGYWEGAIDENTPCKPLSQYGIAKNALRQALLAYAAGKDVNVYWLRAYYILGDDAHNHSIFAKILEAANEGKTTFPFTSGKNLYDFITVDQLAKYIALASTQTEVAGIINVCTGKPMSLADRVEQFIKDNKLSIKLQYGAFPDRPYDSPGEWGDPTKINRILKNAAERE
jgi:dTDP-6-deoxy-L-talose 4-dehydrogenase (NAD+)